MTKDEYIERAMLSSLKEQAWSVVAGSAAVVLIIGFFYSSRVDASGLLMLLGLILCLLIARLCVSLFANPTFAGGRTTKPWFYLYGTYMGLTGCLWGLVGWYLSEHLPTDQLLIYLFCMAGLAAGATSAAAAHPQSYILYNVPVTLGIIYMYRSNQYGTIWVPIILMTVFVLVTLATCLKLHKMLKKSIIFGFENAELAGRLNRKTQSLHEANSRLAELLEDQHSKLDSLRSEQEQSTQKTAHLQKIAFTDALTSIPNRRAFDLKLEEQWNIAQRNALPFSLLMVDIDFFKSYNDHGGHQLGDECIARIAAVLSQNLRRASDTLCRYGGEEFSVILSYESGLEAEKIAEELREAVVEESIPHPDPAISIVTISLGVGSLHPDADNEIKDLINLADTALYRAKRGGRNQTVLAQP